MKRTYTKALCSALILLFYFPLFSQSSDYSDEQIIGKWNLTSASFNGIDVAVVEHDPFSFEFTNRGEVTLIKPNGTIEKGNYLVKEGKLIDPDTPEFLSASILTLTNDELILAMHEDQNEVVMVFSLEEYASK